MTEMREWWANVYPNMFDMDRAVMGDRYPDRGSSILRAQSASTRPLFRIHVRLKPEGAPKRYASEGERHAWNRNPSMARWHRENGMILEVERWAWPL